MKILCVIDSLGSGGAQRQLVNLALGFKERKHDVMFLVYHKENFYNNILKDNDIKVHEIIEKGYIRRLIKMRKFIRSGNYDAVLSFLEASNFICEVAGLPRRKWKLVVGERSANPNILNSLKLRSFRWFHFLADYIIANSHDNMRIVKEINPFLPSNKCKVIYNIVDFGNWKPNLEFEFKKNGKLNIIVIASHQYLKNLKGLVEAVALLDETEKKQLIVSWYGGISNDNSKEEAVKLINKYCLNDIFNFYEPTLNIVEKLRESDILGLFSYYEGLPNVICEAMSTGKVVISSNVSDIPLLIKNRNLLFNPLFINEISEVIRYVMSLTPKDAKCISERNYNYAQINFNKEKIVNEYLQLFA